MGEKLQVIGKEVKPFWLSLILNDVKNDGWTARLRGFEGYWEPHPCRAEL